MLTSLLAGDGRVIGGAIESRAQLPLLLGQFTEPVLTTITVSSTTIYGVDVTRDWSPTAAQLPLLLAQFTTAIQRAETGTLTAGTINGVDLVGSGSSTVATGTVQAGRFHGVSIFRGGFAPTSEDAPLIEISLDLTDPTLPTRTWTNVTPWVRSVQIARGGRNHELQRSEAGTAVLVLDNRNGVFDPDNTDSPLYGLRRMQWVRVRALYGTQTYDRAVMLIESIRQDWPAAGFDATTTLSLVDAMKAASLFDLQGETFERELTGTRVENVAALIGLDVNADTGQSTVVPVENRLQDDGTQVLGFAEGSAALEHLRQVEETENGQLFVNGSGVLTFHDRHHRPRDFTVAGIVGNSDGEIPYQTASLDMDDGAIWNTVRVTTSDGQVREVADTGSQQRYYPRRLNRTLLTDDDNEAQAAAEYLLLLYAEPPARLPAIQLVGQNDPTSWPAILGLGNGDRLTWRIRPLPEQGARLIEKSLIVERVSETIVPNGVWRTTVDVSPADPFDLWVLGDSDRGVLNTTTRLGY